MADPELQLTFSTVHAQPGTVAKAVSDPRLNSPTEKNV